MSFCTCPSPLAASFALKFVKSSINWWNFSSLYSNAKTIVLLSGSKSIITVLPIFDRSSYVSYSINNFSDNPRKPESSLDSIFVLSSSLNSLLKSSKVKELPFDLLPMNLSNIERSDVFPQLFFPITNDKSSSKSSSKSFKSL